MRTVFYLTTDEVNGDLAARLAAQVSLQLDILFPKELSENGKKADGLIVDLDHLGMAPADGVRLARDLCRRLAASTAVHSYNLEAEQIEDLHNSGVLVQARLDGKLLRRLIWAMDEKTKIAAA